MPNNKVVIIGAGVIGCSIAYHLAKRGISSEIIERESIATRASGKAWAIICYPPRLLAMEGQPPDRLTSMPMGSIQPWLELCWLGYHRLFDVVQEIREEGAIDVQFDETPTIMVALSESEEQAQRASLSKVKDTGHYECEWLSADDVKAIFPDINPRVRGGALFPYFQIEPYRFTLGLAQAAEKIGVTIRQGEVVGFRCKGSRVKSVTLATGTEVEADIVVLAMGTWSGQGTAWLGGEIPIQVNRDECVRLEVPQRLPSYQLRTLAGHTILPKVDGSVLLGHAGVSDLQNSFDVNLVTEEGKTDLLEGAIDLLPSLQEAKLIEHRGDFEAYSVPPKNIQPVIGRLPKWDNAYVAARFGTMGFNMALGTGQCMADLIINRGLAPLRVKTMMDILSPARLE